MTLTATDKQSTVSDLLSDIQFSGQTWAYTDLSAGSGFMIPASEAALFHAVLLGSASLACSGGTTRRLTAGDAVVLLSGEAHALRTSADSAATRHPVLCEPTRVDVPPTVCIDNGRTVVTRVLSGRLDVKWPRDVRRATLPPMVQVSGTGAMDSGLLQPQALALAGIGAGAAALLTRLAGLMIVAALRADPRCRGFLVPKNDEPIAKALLLIEKRASEPWTVARLARAVGMGRSTFAAQFTQVVGRSPMDALADRRMHEAAILLRETKLKAAQIAKQVGYRSEAAFSRKFAKHFGTTPSGMRELAAAQAGPDAPISLFPGRWSKKPSGESKSNRGRHAAGARRSVPFVGRLRDNDE